ncbi:MAG TPA: ABC transporter substrate-binding protein [Steroidobacteraceae bacterium]
MIARGALTSLLLGALAVTAAAGNAADTAPSPTPALQIVYLTKEDPTTPRGSLMDPVVGDYGWQGARFGIEELNASGRFLGKRYDLIKLSVSSSGDVQAAARDALAAGHALIVADLKAPDLLAVADLPQARQALLLDARSSDDALRQADCRGNVFHLLPNWAMRADAIGQYLARRHWTRWFLLTGTSVDDHAYADAIERSAARVGAHIVVKKSFQVNGIGDSAEEHEQIQARIPTLTHVAIAYDVLIVADTADAFGDYLLFHTFDPRLVAGTHGLRAVAWDSDFREYAARGVQYRFHLLSSRDMTERDYGNWLATAIIGDAVTRGGVSDAPSIRAYLLSKNFSMAAFKGEGLSFRPWDLQLRQPLLLFGSRALVSMWPLGDSGQISLQTDAIGYGAKESRCRMTGGHHEP